MSRGWGVEGVFGGNPVRNEFIQQLLMLQQDGRQAISAPSSWLQEPLLRVETETIRQARAFADLMCADNVGPQWLVLVGGPGNGKSMAVRELTARLQDRGLKIQDEGGIPLSQMERQGRPVPAVLEVRDATGSLLARIAQDASVVTDPYAMDPNPARDLRDLLARCLRDRCHLVACANRGVLEAAAALPDVSTLGLGGILESMATVGLGVGTENEVRHEVGDITLTARPMDVGSLFRGAHSVFEQLLEQATREDRWRDCEACQVSAACPFLANRNDLVDRVTRSRVLRLLEDAELLDGQPVVFREAGALVSLLLAGCPADYNGAHPCDWVASQERRGAWFHLAARRVHMVLFSAYAPLGLSEERDFQALREVCSLAGLDADAIFAGIPSTNVGLSRLLGQRGVMRILDPLSEPADERLSRWEGGYFEGPEIGIIERECQRIWDRLDEALQERDEDATTALAALARWTISHTLRMGALREGLHSWHMELDGLREAIGIPEKPSVMQKRQLSELIRKVLDSRDGIRVSANVRVDQEACGEIKINWEESFARRSICISMGESKEVLAQIPASTFVWLLRRFKAPLHDGTFPSVWLNSAREAVARAASVRMYSRNESGTLWVERNDGCVYDVIWENGQVEVGLRK